MGRIYEPLDDVRKKKSGQYYIVLQKVREIKDGSELYRLVYTDKMGRIYALRPGVASKDDLLELMKKAKLKGWF